MQSMLFFDMPVPTMADTDSPLKLVVAMCGTWIKGNATLHLLIF